MSWWDTKGFTSLATQALKNAQKKIDKVLEIDEAESSKSTGKVNKTSQLKGTGDQDASSKETSDSWNSWNTWLGYKPSGEGGGTEADTEASPNSSWSLPWGLQDISTSPKHAEAAAPSLTPASTAGPASSLQSSSPSSAAPLKGSLLKSKLESTSVQSENAPVASESKQVKEQSPLPDLSKGGSAAGHDIAVSITPEESAGRESEKDVHAVQTDVERTEQEAQVEDKEIKDEQCSVDDSLPSVFTASEPEALEKCEQADYASAKIVTLEDEDSVSFMKTDICVESDPSEMLESMGAYSASDGRSDGRKEKDIFMEQSVNETETATSHFSSGHLKSEQVEELVLNVCPHEEAFETITRDSSKDTLESLELVGSAQGSSAEASDESFCVHIPSGEDLQHTSTSITSNSSEPMFLSLSTEDSMGNLATSQAEQILPDVDVFSPPSHSSVASEEDMESKSSPLETSMGADERTLSVVSPRFDSTATLSSESSETSRMDSSIDTVVERGENSHMQLEDADTEDSQHGDGLMLESLSDADANSPSASFVKCMIQDIEEAMEDASKLEDSGSDNHSEEKSESSKVDSEFEKSVYSGHESSDEIETTTSSDIEIISTPTPNGEKNIVDLSRTLVFSLQKAASARAHGQGHQRSDSQSSSSTHSKGEPEQLFAERDLDLDRHDWHREDDDYDNPQHPQRLLKKLAEMAEILQARETRLVQLSKDNNDLLETNSILRSQLQQAEEARDAEMTDLNALTEEFTRRMGESERKMQAVLKEKDALKQQMQMAQGELAKRAADTSLQAVLDEKDEQLAGLMEEGEKLSKQQLQNSNIIKKLRSKEKENEAVLASQKKKIEQQTEELDQLKKVLDAKEDTEKKQADAIKQLNTAVQMLEKENAKMKLEVDSADEKIRGLQATLDNSYKEIAELHKSNASQDSRAQQAALSAEMQVREELKMAMEQESQRYRQEREALITQIEDLRLSMARMEKDHNRREEMLKQEISDLQMRLQEDESRTQDLTHSVTSATRPLLRQIENLQTTHSIQTAAWERVEKNLAERLSDAQTALALAQEKERAATERLTEVTSRCTALEASNSQLRQEKAQLAAQRDSDRRKIDFLEDRKASDLAQLELTKQKLSDEVASLRKDKVFLESQLETERSRLEAERQHVAVAEEQIRILERERPRSRGTPSPVSVSRQESMTGSFMSEHSLTPVSMHRSWQDEGEGHFMTPPGLKTSLYDSMRQSGATVLVENLQAQLKLREGEISQLQEDIQQLEKTRESMARELVNLTNLNEELQEKIEELPKLQENYQALDSRYNALLQMYGEKEEQVQELMLDLEDVKEMYKTQINALMPT